VETPREGKRGCETTRPKKRGNLSWGCLGRGKPQQKCRHERKTRVPSIPSERGGSFRKERRKIYATSLPGPMRYLQEDVPSSEVGGSRRTEERKIIYPDEDYPGSLPQFQGGE